MFHAWSSGDCCGSRRLRDLIKDLLAMAENNEVPRSYKLGNCGPLWWIQHATNVPVEIGRCCFVQVTRQRLGCGWGLGGVACAPAL